MILVRTVFQAKFGRTGELAAQFVRSITNFPEIANARVLTDLSGPFGTVILEYAAESLDDVFRSRLEMFADPEFAERNAAIAGLIKSGRNEYYTIES